MTLRYSRDAAYELRRAAAHYDAQRPGLGRQFIDAVAVTGHQIAYWPSAGHPFDELARGRIVHGFPYWLIYEQRGAVIFVTAVAHHSRRPGYWRRQEVREPSDVLYVGLQERLQPLPDLRVAPEGAPARVDAAAARERSLLPLTVYSR